MKNSHTLSLIEEAFAKTQKYNYRKYFFEFKELALKHPSIRADGKHIVNNILEKFGLHLMYKSKLDDLVNQNYEKMGKWSSGGTILLALKNSDVLLMHSRYEAFGELLLKL